MTALVNAHAAAVVPGAWVSVNSVLSQLEREPGEFIVDPWVVERATLVAEQRGRIVAAAHLLRYSDSEDVGESYRSTGGIRWFLFWPMVPADAPYWPDAAGAASALMAACVKQLDGWAVCRQYADGALPTPGVYGVPEQWPHVRAAYARAGFVEEGQTEIVYLARVAELPPRSSPPLAGLTSRRSVGINGTRISALMDDDEVGYIEVEIRNEANRMPQQGGLADIGNLHVDEGHRRRGVATWLLMQAAEWLLLAGVDLLLAYACPEEHESIAFLQRRGFHELTRTQRGWVRRGDDSQKAGRDTRSRPGGDALV